MAHPLRTTNALSGVRLMRIHYSSDPEKTPEWAAKERAKGWTAAEWNLEMELDDRQTVGALWKHDQLASCRTTEAPGNVAMIAIAVDPSVTDPSRRKSGDRKPDETGILVGALLDDSRVVLLNDLSGTYAPSDWARLAVRAYNHYRANFIAAEVNQGGDMIEDTIRTIGPNVAFRGVHAKVGKRARAEPVQALYEQGRALHLWPQSLAVNPLERLEREMCTWDARDPSSPSPGRIDALSVLMHSVGLCSGGYGRVTSHLR